MGTVHAKHNFKVEKVVGVQMYLSGINTHTYTEYIYVQVINYNQRLGENK